VTQLHALLLTLACELPVVVLLAGSSSFTRVLIVAAGASCLTHPIAWRTATVLSPAEYSIGIALIEAGVVVIEMIWYQFFLRISWKKAFKCSLFANATSFGLGWVLL
jgi:hypothetical protein